LSWGEAPTVTTDEQSKRNKRLAWLLIGIFVVLLIGSTVILMMSMQGR
jgi:flagellar basal body-associated protein FliL